LEVTLPIAEVNPDDIPVTLDNFGSAFGGEDYQITPLEGFRFSGYMLHSTPFGTFATDAYVWDLQPGNPGREWLVLYSIHFNMTGYEDFRQNTLLPIVASLTVDGQALASATTMNPPAGNILSLDTPTRDNLQPRETREWRFQAVAGQELVIRMDAIDDVDPLLVLLDADRNTLEEDDDSGEGSNAQLVFEVPQDGEYIVLASFFDPTDTGAYEIAVQSRLSFATEGGELVNGSVTEGEISDEAFETRYTFQGNANDTVTITMSSIDGELDCYLILLDPSGEVLAENDDHDSGEISLFFSSDAAIVDVTLPSSGTYTILAGRYQGASGSSEGDYEITLAFR
jgi:hypothetical protein